MLYSNQAPALRRWLNLAPGVLVHYSNGSSCYTPTTSVALLRTRRNFQRSTLRVRHAPTTSSALSFISQEKRSDFSRCAPTRSSALILRLQKSRDFLAWWLRASSLIEMSFCLCYTEREQKCGTADSIGDSRCCIISQSTDPTKLPGGSFCRSCENVRRRPKQKAKKLCECSEHNSQRCGADPAILDQR